MTQKQGQKQLIESPEKLTDDLKQFSDFIKSLTLSLPKQGRRLLSLSSLQKSRNVMATYVKNQKSYKFTEFQEYADLLSKESQARINEQIYKRVLNLQNSLRSYQFQQKMKEKEKQLQRKANERLEQNQKTVNKKEKKQEKASENITFSECVKEYEEIKSSFYKIWKEEYFIIMNYRMAITAKELQRWTEIAEKKTTKNQISKQVDSLFS